MATIIALSSLVARGKVGLRITVPALERLGHEVVALPTVLLSNHRGHRYAGGSDVDPSTLEAMVDALDANGWLATVDAILTGYLPTSAHVLFAEALIARVCEVKPDARVFCDPILGDMPKGLYVPADVAAAVRDGLVPRATHLRPNRFELSFLAGRPVDSEAEAVAAARSLEVPVVLASSIPDRDDKLANMLVTRDAAWVGTVPLETAVPSGTGDLLTALFAGHCLRGGDPARNAGAALGSVATAIAASRGFEALQITGLAKWHEAPPIALRPYLVAPG
jgi:pyridoxine kinase